MDSSGLRGAETKLCYLADLAVLTLALRILSPDSPNLIFETWKSLLQGDLVPRREAKLSLRVDLVPIGVPATSTALPTTSIPSTPVGWSASPSSKESSRVTESMNGEESGARLRSSSFPPFVILQQQPLLSLFSLWSHLVTCRRRLTRAS